MKYTASYGDLINAFHTNTTAATTHYINYGYYEGRVASFDARAEVAAERNDRRAVVAAFEQATGRAVADVVERARAAAAASAR
jgi:serralysin